MALSLHEWRVIVEGDMGLTVFGFIEAMTGVTVRSEDGDAVTAVLQCDSSVDHQALGTAYAQIWVKKDYVLLLLLAGHGVL